MELAAQASVLGVDGGGALSGDHVGQLLVSAQVKRALAFRQALHDDLAVKIAERIGELFSDS